MWGFRMGPRMICPLWFLVLVIWASLALSLLSVSIQLRGCQCFNKNFHSLSSDQICLQWIFILSIFYIIAFHSINSFLLLSMELALLFFLMWMPGSLMVSFIPIYHKQLNLYFLFRKGPLYVHSITFDMFSFQFHLVCSNNWQGKKGEGTKE